MRLSVNLQQALDVHVGVDLRRGERGVAEQFLDDAQVGPGFQQVGGEGVAEGVGGNPLLLKGGEYPGRTIRWTEREVRRLPPG